MLTVLHIDDIVSDPKIRGGRPIIAGTTIRVSDIAVYHIYDAQTPEELAVGFRLDLAKVYAALAYYSGHRDEIDAEIRANSGKVDQYMRELKVQGKLIVIE